MKKRLLALFLVISMCLSLMPVSAAAANPVDLKSFFTGTGTAEDPYLLSTAHDLSLLADIVNSGISCADTYFKLTADVSGVNTVIGINNKVFEGHFDGGHHTVTLSIEDTSLSHVGLFGDLAANGSVSNVTTAGSVTGIQEVGGVCGLNKGTIVNCANLAVLKTNSWNVGGMCGSNVGGRIYNCYNLGKITADNQTAGGVCGLLCEGGEVINCYNAGEVTSNSAVGAVCGKNTNTNGSFTNCYYDSDIASIYGCGDGADDGIEDLSGDLCKAASGTSGALIDLLNGYIKSNSGATAGWLLWCLGSNSYPELHVHDFTGDYVDRTVDNVHQHARKCTVCGAVGDYVACVFDQVKVDPAYVKAQATCMTKTVYYKSCVCGYCDRSGTGFEDPNEAAPTGHAWKYRAIGNVLIAECGNCTDPSASASLTLIAKDKVYDGQPANDCVTISDKDKEDWTTTTLLPVKTVPPIKYYDSNGNALDPISQPPTDAGTYTAKITAGSGSNEATAEVTFTIMPAPLVIRAENKNAIVGDTAPDLSAPVKDTDFTILLGGNMVDNDVKNGRLSISLTANPDMNTAGSYDIEPSIGGAAKDNYTCTFLKGTLTVNPPKTVPVPSGVTYTYNGKPQTLMTLPYDIDWDSNGTTASYDPITGEFTGTYAGEYKVVLKLADGKAQWSDGTKENKTITFTINPAPLIIAVKDKTATAGDSVVPPSAMPIIPSSRVRSAMTSARSLLPSAMRTIWT